MKGSLSENPATAAAAQERIVTGESLATIIIEKFKQPLVMV